MSSRKTVTVARIDLAALKRASEGDPSVKVAVTKAWLKAVYDVLTIKAEMDRKTSNLESVFRKAGLDW